MNIHQGDSVELQKGFEFNQGAHLDDKIGVVRADPVDGRVPVIFPLLSEIYSNVEIMVPVECLEPVQ